MSSCRDDDSCSNMSSCRDDDNCSNMSSCRSFTTPKKKTEKESNRPLLTSQNLTNPHLLTRYLFSTSSLLARFILRRRRGYFILQIYAPCAMIVGASWVSFWINKSDAPGRVAVGATTVLTLVTMGFGGRSSLPRVAYATAIDWFVILCFSFSYLLLWWNMRASGASKENGEDLTAISESCDTEEKPVICHQKFRPFRWKKKKKRYREISTQMEDPYALDRGSRIDAYARVLFPWPLVCSNLLLDIILVHNRR
ncbi:gamma-aminobutyric acid receptor subunit alpha-6 [Caerostris extrusa]|uniref:Gamma-aminobutyric acid receptor subunit alpha-6 n=1 Tax=Caerostris extrusa TaxID=172846 RepID=A0AAV4WK76_CAEEX|nr:gamma-aminobutyric acid receptor subunit alpha-6 [Caerostris extrusa]